MSILTTDELSDEQRRELLHRLDSTEALAKALAIKLAVSELEKVQTVLLWARPARAQEVIKNLIIGLGCKEVVDAWEECT